MLVSSRESSAIKSWSCDLTTGFGCSAFLIAGLPDDASVIRDHSSESLILQKPFQINQRRDRYLRLANLQSRTGAPVQHPCRNNNGHTGLTLDHHHVRTSALLAIIPTDTAPIERVPSVVQFYLFTDMGRMTQQLPWAEKHGCSRVPTVVANAQLRCIP